MGFYIGGKLQWSKDGGYADYNKLIEGERTVLSINHVGPIVDVMTGMERQARSALKAVPQGDDDDEDARILTWLLTFEQEQTGFADRHTEVFEDGIITGLDCLEIGIDYNAGKKPRITIDRRRPGIDILWDPFWTRYDGSDARYWIKFKMAFVQDLIAEYPEHKAELLAAVGQLRELVKLQGVTTKDASDAYGHVRNHPVENLDHELRFFDPRDSRLMVMEVYYRIYETVWVVVDTDTDTIEIEEDLDGEPLTSALAHSMAAGDPTHLKAKGIEVRKVRMSTLIPSTYQVLEAHKNPYPNDDDHYPFSLYIAKRKRDHIYGIVRNLKDPQRVENKRWAQVLDILARFGNPRLLIPEGSVLNPEKVNADDDSPLVYRPDKGKPEFLVPPIAELANVLTALALQMKMNLRDTSGVNTAQHGIREGDESGIALARLQAQGNIIATLFFDNLRKTRKYSGQRLARRIQQVYTAEDTVRLTNELGEPVLVTINPRALRTKDKEALTAARKALSGAGKPHVLRDPSALKYDVVLSDAPATPTARALAFQGLLDTLKVAPMLTPLVLDVLVELGDFPERAKILKRVQMMLAASLAGPPPAGGGGADGLPTEPTPTGPPTPPTAEVAA